MGSAGTTNWVLVGGYGTNWGNLEMHAGVVPQMTLEPHGPYLTLSWPTNTGALNLEFTTNVAPPVVWLPAYYSPEGTNFTTRAYVDYIGPNGFFRLTP